MAIFSTLSDIDYSEDFKRLISKVSLSIEKDIQSDVSKYSKYTGNQFEELAFLHFISNSEGTPFEGTIYHTADRDFPDIVARNVFGVEVKATKKDDWTSIGNSILESSRIKSVEKIYLLFGKLGGIPKVKYREYEKCLRGVSVTHYPRYQIDMNLAEGESIFDKIGIEYNTLRRKKDPVEDIRLFYRSQMGAGESLWWIGDSVDDIQHFDPVIKNYSNLTIDEKKSIKANLMVVFPAIFSRMSTQKYRDIPAYLASRHGVVCSNVRDIFSAGGKVSISYKSTTFTIPQVIYNMLESKEYILSSFRSISEQTLQEYWVDRDCTKAPLKDWLCRVDTQVGVLYADNSPVSIKVSELFEHWSNS